MALDKSTDTYRAVIVPDPRFTFEAFDNVASVLTTANPLPGVPVAQQETEMVLQTSGTQSSAKQLRVRCQRSGFPSPSGGSFVWKEEADALWRGWDPPQTISGFEFVDYTTTLNWTGPHAVTLTDGTIVVVVEKQSAAQVICWRRNPSTGAWTDATVFTHAGGFYVYQASPTIVVLPSGRLLCFAWVEDSTNTDNQVSMHYSDDDGATWTLGQGFCLETPVNTSPASFDVRRLRAAYLNGQILLVGSVQDPALTYGDVIVQFASNDLGSTFQTIETWTGASESTSAAFPDLVSVGDAFVLAYLREEAATAGDFIPYVRTISSAYTPLSGVSATRIVTTLDAQEWGTATSNNFTDGELALFADEDGTLYVVGRDFDAGNLDEVYILRSIDTGATWDRLGTFAAGLGAPLWNGRDGSTYPKDFCAVMYGGRTVLLHTFAASPETHDPSLCATYFGGYTSVCLPSLDLFVDPLRRVGWERTWLPFDLPDNTGGIYTAVTAGPSPTATMTSTGVRLQAGNILDAYQYSLTVAPVSTLLQGMISEWHLEVDDSTAVMTMRVANATPVSYAVNVEATTTTLVLRDTVSGAAVATISGLILTSGVQVRIAIGNEDAGLGNTGKVQAWYRITTKGGETEHDWILIGTSTSLQAAAVANNHIAWGYPTGSATTDVRFRFHGYTYSSAAGQQMYKATQTENPTDLLGRSFAAVPLFVDDGVRVKALDGPAFRADEWDIDTRYERGVEHIHPEVSPSPRRGWRTTNTVQQTIEWELDATPEQLALLGPSIGVALLECNFRTARFEGQVNAGTWTTLVDFDTATDQGAPSLLRFDRFSETVVPGFPAHLAGNYFTQNILANSYIEMITGETPVVRRILQNSEGAWTNQVTKRARLYIADKLASDPTTGTCRIWSKDIVGVAHDIGRYHAFRLVIPAQTTAEGYFKLGKIVVGHVHYFGRQYSLGRIKSAEPTFALETSRSGARRATQLGPMRRVVQFGWNELVPARRVQVKNAVPNYQLPATAATEPTSTPNDTLMSLQGLVERLGGASTPCVLLESLPKGSLLTPTQLNNRNTFLYGRFTSNPRIETVWGNEWENEAQNMPPVSFEEEV
jgi:hypothetical protein